MKTSLLIRISGRGFHHLVAIEIPRRLDTPCQQRFATVCPLGGAKVYGNRPESDNGLHQSRSDGPLAIRTYADPDMSYMVGSGSGPAIDVGISFLEKSHRGGKRGKR